MNQSEAKTTTRISIPYCIFSKISPNSVPKQIKIKHNLLCAPPFYHLPHHAMAAVSSAASSWQNTFSWDRLWSGLMMSQEKRLAQHLDHSPARSGRSIRRKTHPEIVNSLHNRTSSHLKSGTIFAAYLCPKGVVSIHEFILVRCFDVDQQRLLSACAVWLSNPTGSLESHWTGQQGGQRGSCPPLRSYPVQSSLPAPCRSSGGKLHAWSVRCTVPLYSQCRGNPLCAYFQFTFQNSIGNGTDFQLWFTEQETTGPGTVLGSHAHPFFRGVQGRKPYRRAHSAFHRMCHGAPGCQRLPMHGEQLHTCKQASPVNSNEMKGKYSFAHFKIYMFRWSQAFPVASGGPEITALT